MILETVPSKTARIRAPCSVVILTPLLKVSMPLRTGCACTPKRSIIAPRSTGQGSFPLLEVKLSASSCSSGVSANTSLSLLALALAKRISSSIILRICLSSSSAKRCLD